MKRPRSTLAVTAVLVVLAGCGSGGASDADSDIASSIPASPAQCGLGTGQPATGEPIRIGAIATMSGGLDFSSSPRTATAYFDCVNANGGINGRPIDYVIDDDGLDPQKASALATKFAGDSSVVAMTGGASFVACAANQPIFERANLFDILGVGVPQACFFSKNMSAVNAGPRLSAVSATQQLVKDFGIKSVAGTGYSIPGLGEWVKEGMAAYAERSGIELKYFDLVLPPVRDATSLVTTLRSQQPDALVTGWGAPDNATYLKAVEQQALGDQVRIGCLTPCYDTTFPGQIGPYWNGKLYSNSEFALLDSTGEDNLNWRRVLQEYGTPDQPRDSFSQAGYIAARVLVDALLKLPADGMTRDTVSAAIRDIKGFRTDMLCKPWYFSGPSGHNNANHALFNVKLDESGKYVQAADCYETEDPQLADILTAEQADPSVLGGGA